MQVAERSLFLWNNEYIVSLVAQHRTQVITAGFFWVLHDDMLAIQSSRYSKYKSVFYVSALHADAHMAGMAQWAGWCHFTGCSSLIYDAC